MRVTALIHADRNDIDLSVPDPPLRHDGIRKAPHCRGGALEDDAFQTMVVVQMRMHGGDGQVVMMVLQRRQSFGQIALMMVEHVRKIGDAIARFCCALACNFHFAPQQIADGLRAVLVATYFSEAVKFPGKVFVKRDGDAFHANLGGLLIGICKKEGITPLCIAVLQRQ